MYAVALMSTPRVGWAAISMVGRRESSRAMISFWMLPPERFFSGVSRPGVFTANSLHQLPGVLFHPGEVQEDAA